MLLSDLSVRRPVFATVIGILLFVFGLFAFTRLPLREYPDIDPPIVSIETRYTGAAANIVETRITELIEDSIAGVLAGVAAGMQVLGFMGGGHIVEGHGDNLLKAGAAKVLPRAWTETVNKARCRPRTERTACRDAPPGCR